MKPTKRIISRGESGAGNMPAQPHESPLPTELSRSQSAATPQAAPHNALLQWGDLYSIVHKLALVLSRIDTMAVAMVGAEDLYPTFHDQIKPAIDLLFRARLRYELGEEVSDE